MQLNVYLFCNIEDSFLLFFFKFYVKITYMQFDICHR